MFSRRGDLLLSPKSRLSRGWSSSSQIGLHPRRKRIWTLDERNLARIGSVRRNLGQFRLQVNQGTWQQNAWR